MADAGAAETLLQWLEKVDGGVDSIDVGCSLGLDHQVVVGAVKSLLCLGEVRFSDWKTRRKSISPFNTRAHFTSLMFQQSLELDMLPLIRYGKLILQCLADSF